MAQGPQLKYFFTELLVVLRHPSFLYMLYPYNKKTDETIMALMNPVTDGEKQSQEFFLKNFLKTRGCLYPLDTEHTSYIWLSNYPYAYGSINYTNNGEHLMPRRSTVLNFKKFIDTAPEKYPEYKL